MRGEAGPRTGRSPTRWSAKRPTSSARMCITDLDRLCFSAPSTSLVGGNWTESRPLTPGPCCTEHLENLELAQCAGCGNWRPRAIGPKTFISYKELLRMSDAIRIQDMVHAKWSGVLLCDRRNASITPRMCPATVDGKPYEGE